MSNEPLSEQLFKAGTAWADKNAAADLLEELKSATLAEWSSEVKGVAVNRAEMQIKASARWHAYLKDMVKARHDANLAKVRLEYLKARFQEWQSAEANHRVQARA
jgi:hypothetical protein